jgi:hypothetical protein
VVGGLSGLRYTDELQCARLSFHGPTLSKDTANNLVVGGYREFLHAPCPVPVGCGTLPRTDPHAAPLVLYNQVWCHLLGKGKELSFQFLVDDRWVGGTPARITVHYASDHPLSLVLCHPIGSALLPLCPGDGWQTATATIPLGDTRVFQGTLSHKGVWEDGPYILHISAQLTVDRWGGSPWDKIGMIL